VLSQLNREGGIIPKTVAKPRKRQTVGGCETAPTASRPTVLAEDAEAMVVAFRRRTLLPPDEYICKIRTSEPKSFTLNPIRQMRGLKMHIAP
jgi:hypothetical protein